MILNNIKILSRVLVNDYTLQRLHAGLAKLGLVVKSSLVWTCKCFMIFFIHPFCFQVTGNGMTRYKRIILTLTFLGI